MREHNELELKVRSSEETYLDLNILEEKGKQEWSASDEEETKT
jgi:hypothetical protein